MSPRGVELALWLGVCGSLVGSGPAAAQTTSSAASAGSSSSSDLGGAGGTTTANIVSATVSALPSCLAYKVTGVCFFLRCTPFGCSVKTSIRVSHYVPDVIVSSFNAPEQHPWTDVGRPVARALSSAGSSWMGLALDATANTAREGREVVTFKSTDAIGHPVGAVMGGNYDFEYPDQEELMKFPSQELPRIWQQWAAVPQTLGNQVLEGARQTAANPSALLGDLARVPGQVAGLLDAVSNLNALSALAEQWTQNSRRDEGAQAGSAGGSGHGQAGGVVRGSDEGASNGGGGRRDDNGDGDGSGAFGQKLQNALARGGAGASPYLCPGGSGVLSLHYHSELDSLFWRGKIPLELLYPASWVPGLDEVGQSGVNTWGGTYPRMGELVQSHPRKAAAVYAHRTASIIRREAQPHLYKRLRPKGGNYVYFASMADPRWQPVHPVPESTCIAFGHNDATGPGSWGDHKTAAQDGYVWNLWQRYECCERAAEIFLFAVP